MELIRSKDHDPIDFTVVEYFSWVCCRAQNTKAIGTMSRGLQRDVTDNFQFEEF
jgi:hypothetical protein